MSDHIRQPSIMIEAVARAMHENECRRYAREPVGDWAWETLNAWQFNYWRAAARAALAALREPSEAMLRAAVVVAGEPNEVSAVVWRAMIDCALAEGGQSVDSHAKR